MKKLLLIIVLVVSFTSCSTKIKADLLVYNATIYTVDSSSSVAEAMVVKDGKIVETGKASDLQSKYDAKEKLDAQGKFIYPGFIDAHAHFVGYGQSLFTVDLYDSKSIDEVVKKVKDFDSAHPNETWILGRGWDQNKFPSQSFPTNDALNKLFPDKPVLLERVDGHASIANDKAFELAGVKAGDKIPGGEIETKNGKLTGILIDNAVDLVAAKI